MTKLDHVVHSEVLLVLAPVGAREDIINNFRFYAKSINNPAELLSALDLKNR
jgi:hypothetical protein